MVRNTAFLAFVCVGTAVYLAGRSGHRETEDPISNAFSVFWDLFKPGGKLHPAYFLEHQGHLFLEGILVAVIVLLYFQQSFKPYSKASEPLTEKEIIQLCDEWQPEPLVNPVPDNVKEWEPPVISSPPGVYVVANGKKVLDMVTYNFVGAGGNEKIKELCQETINKYGVGSCGPRGFYGTIDVHLKLEEDLARFMGSESAIIYSYDLATLPSVIPAFANRQDLIVCDEGVNYSIQKGCNLSRSKILYFKHNDMADLERVLKKVAQDDKTKHKSKPLNRRFIAVEGIYHNLGDVCPLDQVYQLKEKYRFRLIVDESMSLGVMGATGRGACQHFGLKPSDVEIIGASMGTALGSCGGFCASTEEVTSHQRLSGQGYCFSASLPPFLAAAAIGALQYITAHCDQLVQRVQDNARLLRQLLSETPGLRVVGGAEAQISPLVHVQLVDGPEKEGDAEALLQQIVDDSFRKEGVLFTVASYSFLDKHRAPPSIKVTVSACHEEQDVKKAAAALKASAKRVLKQSGWLKSPSFKL